MGMMAGITTMCRRQNTECRFYTPRGRSAGRKGTSQLDYGVSPLTHKVNFTRLMCLPYTLCVSFDTLVL
jgi:hypothetical protein